MRPITLTFMIFMHAAFLSIAQAQTSARDAPSSKSLASPFKTELKVAVDSANPKLKSLSISRALFYQNGNRGPNELGWAEIYGAYPQPKVSLLLNHSNQIVFGPDYSFKVKVPLRGVVTSITFTSIDSKGAIEEESFSIRKVQAELIPSLAKAPTPPLNAKVNKKIKYSLGLGVTSQSYSDQANFKFSQTAITTKAGASYPLEFLDSVRPRWDVGLSGYLTLFSLSKNNNTSVRFLGVNGRLGFTLPKISYPWTVQINGGFYYASMLVSPYTFGYQNVFGPQVFPTVKRSFGLSQSLLLYLKYSPVTSGTQLMKLNNRELAVGMVYSWPAHFQKQDQYWMITLDLVEFKIQLADLSALSRSATLGTGVTF